VLTGQRLTRPAFGSGSEADAESFHLAMISRTDDGQQTESVIGGRCLDRFMSMVDGRPYKQHVRSTRGDRARPSRKVREPIGSAMTTGKVSEALKLGDGKW
jgi:hypothetical protein